MLILSLDTTTRAGSVAIVRDGRVLYEARGDSSRTHAQRLPGELMSSCAAAGVAIADVQLFAVAAGPGSFTGLRIGIATVQGLAMARARKVVPVSSLEALAAAAPGHPTRVAAWMDAQRGEVFAQVFERTAASCRPLADAISAPPATILAAHEPLLDGGTVFVGDGALRYRDQIAAARGTPVRIVDEVPALAGAIGRIAHGHPERAVNPHAIVPVYVRRPDAEIARDRRAGES